MLDRTGFHIFYYIFGPSGLFSGLNTTWLLSTLQPIFHLVTLTCTYLFNTLRPRQNGHHFADDIFKCLFFHENVWISIKISMQFVPKGPIYNIPALVQILAWRRPDDNPFAEAMMVSLPTHIYVTRPQWVNTSPTIWKLTLAIHMLHEMPQDASTILLKIFRQKL